MEPTWNTADSVSENERGAVLYTFDRLCGDVDCPEHFLIAKQTSAGGSQANKWPLLSNIAVARCFQSAALRCVARAIVGACLLTVASGCTGSLSPNVSPKPLPSGAMRLAPTQQPVALRQHDGGMRHTAHQEVVRLPQPAPTQSTDRQRPLSSEFGVRLHDPSITFHAPDTDWQPLRLGTRSDSQPLSGLGSVLGSVATDIVSDYRNFYSKDSLTMLAGGAAVAAALAHAPIDEPFRDFYQQNVRGKGTDNVSAIFEPLGNGVYTLPVMLGSWVFGEWIDGGAEGGISEWGERSSRAMLVGAPAMLALQVVTGGSRPGETVYGAQWRPFQDSNGVSGHAFMGAVPFLSLAHMTEDPWLRSGLYAASTLTGITRINDDAHYLSQVLFGWWIAWLATTSVDQTYLAERNLQIYPFPVEDGVGAAFEIGF